MPTFKNLEEAINKGYRTVNRKTDFDISTESSPNTFGYDFKNPNGEKTIDVFLSEVKNRMGNKGVYIPMYPPDKETQK